MRIVFIGSKNIGYLCLKQLIEWKKNIVAVIAREDDPHENQWYKSVSELAEENKLNLIKTSNMNDPKLIEQLKKLNTDIFFTAQFPQLYKKEFIKIPKKACINLHFAPLPKYRGCFPTAWAIIDGSDEFGVTIHHIEEGADCGNIIAQKKFPIKEEDNGKTLYEKATRYGLELFKEVFNSFEKNIPKGNKQDEAKVIHHKREFPFGGLIDWNKSSKEIYNFIRALYFPPFPCVFSFLNGEKISIAESQIESNGTGEIGEILRIDDKVVLVKTGDGSLLIKKVQIDPTNFMGAYEFFKNKAFKVGDKFLMGA